MIADQFWGSAATKRVRFLDRFAGARDEAGFAVSSLRESDEASGVSWL
jgi:hypothetical protein